MAHSSSLGATSGWAKALIPSEPEAVEGSSKRGEEEKAAKTAPLHPLQALSPAPLSRDLLPQGQQVGGSQSLSSIFMDGSLLFGLLLISEKTVLGAVIVYTPNDFHTKGDVKVLRSDGAINRARVDPPGCPVLRISQPVKSGGRILRASY